MRIQTKLFLTLCLAGVSLVGLMVMLMQWSVDRGMLAYVNQRAAQEMKPVLTRLAQHYQQHGDWQLLERRREFDLLVGGQNFARGSPRGRGRDRPPPPHHGAPPGMMVLPAGYVDPRNLSLLDADETVVSGRIVGQEDSQRYPIQIAEDIVGWLVRNQPVTITEGFELQFLEKQRGALLVIGLLVLGISGLIAFFLARNLLGPIGKLATAADQLTRGNYQLNLALNRRDELGALAEDVSQLALTLQASETERQRWFADISHELRTPLAILHGEIEAMLDGLRPIDKDRILSLRDEVLHLSRLINDLYELSNSDVGALKYHKEVLDFSELLENVLDQHRDRLTAAGLSLHSLPAPDPVDLLGDPDRLRQLLDNLIDNATKYTDSGGQIRVKLQKTDNWAELTLEDSAPGVSDADLERLFDYLYRADHSRNRRTGGSGLGLAICQRVVEGHAGKINVAHSPLGGLQITLKLPLIHGSA